MRSRRQGAIACGVALALVIAFTGQPSRPLSVDSASAARRFGQSLPSSITFSRGCTSPSGPGAGVGIAFDGKYLWFSCIDTGEDDDLFMAELRPGSDTATVVWSTRVAGGLGALAWSARKHMLWAGWGTARDDDPDVGVIRLFDPEGRKVVTPTLKLPAEANLSRVATGLANDGAFDTLTIADDSGRNVFLSTNTGDQMVPLPRVALLPNGWCQIGGLTAFETGLLLYCSDAATLRVWLPPLARGLDASPDTGVDLLPLGWPPSGASRLRGPACDSVSFSGRRVLWFIASDEPRRAVPIEYSPYVDSRSGLPVGCWADPASPDTYTNADPITDSDGDGLPDVWEKEGITVRLPDGDSTNVNLPRLGADPTRRDVFVHIDWDKQYPKTQLEPDAIEKVVRAFEAHNISLHIDHGPDSVFDVRTGERWGAERSLAGARPL